MSLTVFIKSNVPSSKNSMQRARWGGLFYNKRTTKYIKESESQWIAHSAIFRANFDSLPKPVKISFKFIRNSKHKFDYINPCQMTQDLMTKYGFIPDDNSDEMIPVFEPYEYDKENPGVYISICPST